MQTVLIIDDNEINLELMRALLEAANFIVRTSTSAEAGMALARATKPGLILMDVAMPHIDGLTATRMLKAEAETRNICIVAVTSHARAEDESEARRAGCDGYIAKPIEPATFAAQIASYLKRWGPATETENGRRQ